MAPFRSSAAPRLLRELLRNTESTRNGQGVLDQRRMEMWLYLLFSRLTLFCSVSTTDYWRLDVLASLTLRFLSSNLYRVV